MNKNNFKKISLVIMLISLCLPVFVLATNGTGAGGWSGTLQNPLNAKDFTTLVKNIIGWLIRVGEAVAVLMIIYAGFLYMFSAGRDEEITKAKKTLTYALVGLLILVIGEGFVYMLKELLGVK